MTVKPSRWRSARGETILRRWRLRWRPQRRPRCCTAWLAEEALARAAGCSRYSAAEPGRPPEQPLPSRCRPLSPSASWPVGRRPWLATRFGRTGTNALRKRGPTGPTPARAAPPPAPPAAALMSVAARSGHPRARRRTAQASAAASGRRPRIAEGIGAASVRRSPHAHRRPRIPPPGERGRDRPDGPRALLEAAHRPPGTLAPPGAVGAVHRRQRRLHRRRPRPRRRLLRSRRPPGLRPLPEPRLQDRS